MIDDNLAVVYSTTHPADAEMVKLALESEEIQAFIEGEKQGGLAGVLGVRVCVAPSDAERARKVLSELEHSPVSQQEWDDALAEAPNGEGEP
ncbi:MAG: hypothetical protein B7Z73_03410 [Planctomycetia bacterium 21-64-5]|nr:MAG: hypothetical protein B7Z73_03410 [Planctomycetia bacterium 21-64-5]HQU42964.1 DUF2007 domain-containing protein [Pirellulales bacterium]